MKIQLKRSNIVQGGFAKVPTVEQMDYGELAVNYSAEDPSIFIKNQNNQIIKFAVSTIPNLEDSADQPGTLDDRYVNISGDTMTGDLTLAGDPTADLMAATKKYVDDITSILPGGGGGSTLDDRYLQLTGGTMTGQLFLYNDPSTTNEAANKNYVDNKVQTIVDELPPATIVQDDAPTDASANQLWWSSADGKLYIYYEDPNSSQWVPATPEAPIPDVPVPNPDGGIQIGASGYEIKIRPDEGLSVNSSGLGTVIESGKGIAVGAAGLSISNDWSNIPALPATE